MSNQDLELELRSEQRMETLRKLALPAAVAALLILIGVGINIVWTGHKENTYQDTAQAFQGLVEKANKANDPKIYDEGQALAAPYNTLALLNKAADLAKKSPEESLKALDAVLAQKEADPFLKGSAQLQKILLQFDTKPVQETISDLEKLVNPDYPFFMSAQELLAYAYIRAGQTDKAAALFKSLSTDARSVGRMQRASAWLARLPKTEAPKPTAEQPAANSPATQSPETPSAPAATDSKPSDDKKPQSPEASSQKPSPTTDKH